MAQDILEQLAQLEVPPKPPALGQSVHQRLNRRLLGLHLSELAFQALPYALLQFSQALTGAAVHAATGRFPQDQDKE